MRNDSIYHGEREEYDAAKAHLINIRMNSCRTTIYNDLLKNNVKFGKKGYIQ